MSNADLPPAIPGTDPEALTLVLDLVETICPRLPSRERAPYMTALDRLRRLRVSLLAGEVLVIGDGEAA